jgi:hypothetical protein
VVLLLVVIEFDVVDDVEQPTRWPMASRGQTARLA